MQAALPQTEHRPRRERWLSTGEWILLLALLGEIAVFSATATNFFTLGNFFAGTAGAAYAHVLGFIAPNNFTFGDSLVLVSIVLLGGIGSWGWRDQRHAESHCLW